MSEFLLNAKFLDKSTKYSNSASMSKEKVTIYLHNSSPLRGDLMYLVHVIPHDPSTHETSLRDLGSDMQRFVELDMNKSH